MKCSCAPGIVVAVDVDNLLISSANSDFRGYSMEAGFERMITWLETFGQILCMHLYLPISRCLASDEKFRELWEKHKNNFPFEVVYCPKKSGESGGMIDDVDRHLISHTESLIQLLGNQVKYLCIASGDLDYSPMIWRVKRERGVEIAFAVGNEFSFSKVYRQTTIIAKHPVTGEELVHYFSPRA